MKKILCFLMSFLFFMMLPAAAFAEGEIGSNAKSLLLMDAGSGEVLYSSNEHESLPPASVTKIMTLLLVFEALDEGRISLEDRVRTSDRAAGMGGSQIYLEPGEEMSVDELLKSVVVASANDAAAALAEYVAGSIESFVSLMNRRAAELGMADTHFENTNGLDDTAVSHVTSAYDVALMSRELLKHPKVFDYTTIWMDTVRGGEFTLTNTNRLIRFYQGANGLKTGSTSKAGFCISATALRSGMQLIAVVMGSPTRDERNRTAAEMLDYGFANYEVYTYEGERYSLPATGSTQLFASVSSSPFSLLVKKGQAKKIETKIELPEKVCAPMNKGDQVGRVVFVCEGQSVGQTAFTLTDELPRMGFFDIFLKFLGFYSAF